MCIRDRKECDRLAKLTYGSHEAGVIVGYLENCLELPWNTTSKEHIDLEKARKILDRDHYGLKKVKERILEVLDVYKRQHLKFLPLLVRGE